MTTCKSTYYWLQDKTQSNQIILTVSRRLAKQLIASFNNNQLGNHKLAWSSPQIYYWRDWLKTQYLSNDNASNPIIINSKMATILWEQCIKQVDDNPLLNQYRLADEADQTLYILSDYNIPLSEISDFHETEELLLFSKILGLFENKLNERNWLHPAMLTQYILDKNPIKWENDSSFKEITLAGFYKTPPILSKLITILRSHFSVNYNNQKQLKDNSTIFPYKDQTAEFRAAGAWAYKKLLDKPQARIGILINDNYQSRNIKRSIMEGLNPGWQYRNDEQHISFIHSSGEYLVNYPLMFLGSLLLKWYYNNLSSKEISLLLRSKLLQNIHSSGSYKLEDRLRLFPEKEWSVNEFIEIFKDDALDDELVILEQLELFYKYNSTKGTQKYIRDWFEILNSGLQDIGWTSLDSLNNLGNELMKAWNEILNEIETTQIILKKTSFAYVINRLLISMESSLFELDQSNNNISVMSYEEAAGLEFDYLWVSGMDNEAWPRKMKSIPLLSNEMQKNYKIPNYNASLSFDIQCKLLSMLLCGSQDTVISYAINKNDTLLKPTSMLKIGSTNFDDHPDPHWYLKPFLRNNLIEINEDAPKTNYLEKLTGGTGTIQAYLSDPFTAFVKGRLGVRSLHKFTSGIGPLLRGSLLHDSLAKLYQKKPTLTDIQSWSVTEKKRYIYNATKSVFNKEIVRNDGVLKKLFELEQNRIRLMLFDYLYSETKRKHFKVIEVEKPLSITHSQLKVNLKVDRVDCLHDESFHVIDYKTGTVKSIVKRDDTIRNIQLYVYIAALKYQSATLSFVNFKDRNTINLSTVGLHALNSSLKENFKSKDLESGIQEVKDILKKISLGDIRINIKTQLDINSRSRYLQILSRIRSQ